MRSYLRCFTHSRGFKYMTIYVKIIYLTYLLIKTLNNLCTIEIQSSRTSCHTLYAERKSNMYDSHFALLHAPIRAYTTFSNSALLCDPVLGNPSV